jgi:hypothetical protein
MTRQHFQAKMDKEVDDIVNVKKVARLVDKKHMSPKSLLQDYQGLLSDCNNRRRYAYPLMNSEVIRHIVVISAMSLPELLATHKLPCMGRKMLG